MLAAFVVMTGLYLAVILLWQPLQQQRLRLQDDIARLDREATTLDSIARTGMPPAPVTADMPLPTLVTTTAATAGLTISRLLPTDTAVEVTLDAADFATAVGWIGALEQDHQLRILTLAMTRRPEPGVVTTTVVVGR